MRCPACAGELSEQKQAGIVVDVCDRGCSGIWFDPFELEKVDEAHESAGEALLDLGPHTAARLDHAATRRCPKCPDQAMRRSYFSVRHEVEVDECPGCGGVWLDTGELAAIRNECKTQQECKLAFDQYFSKLFNTELAAQAAKSQEELKRAKKFAHALRFICPSYWIPGKQPGAPY